MNFLFIKEDQKADLSLSPTPTPIPTPTQAQPLPQRGVSQFPASPKPTF